MNEDQFGGKRSGDKCPGARQSFRSTLSTLVSSWLEIPSILKPAGVTSVSPPRLPAVDNGGLPGPLLIASPGYGYRGFQSRFLLGEGNVFLPLEQCLVGYVKLVRSLLGSLA
jgi:hypothetical protein